MDGDVVDGVFGGKQVGRLRGMIRLVLGSGWD